MELRKNDCITVTVTDLNMLGYGVARVEDRPDGKVIFIAGALPRERVQVRIIKVTAGYLVGRVEARLQDSPLRQPSLCASFPACGGCLFCTVPYDYERSRKQAYVKNCFAKEGLHVELQPMVYGKRQGYRNKAEYPLSPEGLPGFYARNSHRVVPMDECGLEHPAFRPILKDLTDWIRESRIPVYNETNGQGLLRHIFLRIGEATGEIMVALVINGDILPGGHAAGQKLADFLMHRHPGVVSVLLNHHKEANNVILGKTDTLLGGKSEIQDVLCGLTFSLSLHSFYQVNRTMAEKLYEGAREMADIHPGDRVVDLFCGVGTIGLSLIKGTDARLLGVEILPQAVENAGENARRNGIGNAKFLCGDANAAEIENADVIVVDPPRKGCGRALLERIARIAPRKLVYISCGPDTLARDAAILNTLGYAVTAARTYDLFPCTGHVETLACFTRT